MNLRPLLRLMIWVYGLAWAFDYRAVESGGSAVQFLFFGVSLASAAVVAAVARERLFVRPVGWISLLWLGYLVSTFVVALVNRVPMAYYLRNMSAPVLVQSSLFVTLAAAAYGFRLREVVLPLLIAGVVNSFWKIVYALLIAKIPLETVRIELLSMSQPFLLGYAMLAVALRPKLPWGAIMIGAIAVLAYVLSVTRSAIFIVAAAGAGCVYAVMQAKRCGVLPTGYGRAKLAHLGAGASLLVVAAVLAWMVSPTVYDRWVDRLFYTPGGEQTELDPSTLTRLAEIKSFHDIMAEEPLTMLYGCGMGHPYYWDESFMPELAYTYYIPTFRHEVNEVWFPGHSIWTYAWFTGGVIGVAVYVGLFAGAVWVAVRSARLLRHAPDYGAEAAYLPLVGILSYLSLSLTFNVFTERSGGIVLGIMIGLPQFLCMEVWRREQGRRSLPAVVPGTARQGAPA